MLTKNQSPGAQAITGRLTTAQQMEAGVPTLIEEKITNSKGEASIRKYIRGKFLGKGGFARVFEATEVETQTLLAVKVVSKESLNKSRAKQKLMSEIKIHRSLENQHVVKFIRFFEDKDNVYIMLELCSNQSLNELIKRRKKMTEIEVKYYVQQLVKGMQYMHQTKVIHRDLKLGNLFLNEKMEVKVGDFGLASKVLFVGEKKRTICGTPNYIAPEILDAKLGHSYEVDLWSLGVITYTLLFGRPPFETTDVKQTYKRIKMNQYEFPEGTNVREEAKDLIKQLLKQNPNERLKLDEILNHNFFTTGVSIPATIPPSTLACPPSSNFVQQYLPRSESGSRKATTDSQQPTPRTTTNLDLAGTQAFGKTLNQAFQQTKTIEREKVMSTERNTQRPSDMKPYISPSTKGTTNQMQRINSEKGFNIVKHFETKPTTAQTSKQDASKRASSNGTHHQPRSEMSPASRQTTSQKPGLLSSSKYNMSGPLDIKGLATERDYKSSGSCIRDHKAPVAADICKVDIHTSSSYQHCTKVLVMKWVDFSSKYGLGYKLSNGTCGVLFNDSTKILLDRNMYHFEYIRRESSTKKSTQEELVSSHDFDHFPKDLKKKVTLLQHFKSYLDGFKFEPPQKGTEIAERSVSVKDGIPFLKKWKRAKKAILFRLSNKIIQVIFQDSSELILSSGSGYVTFISARKEVKSLPLTSDLEVKDPSLYKRLKYAKDILLQMIHKPASKEDALGSTGDCTPRTSNLIQGVEGRKAFAETMNSSTKKTVVNRPLQKFKENVINQPKYAWDAEKPRQKSQTKRVGEMTSHKSQGLI